MTFFEELQWRGLVQDISSPELIDKLNEGGLTFYIGTDPTADSMHIGHYSSFLISKRLAQHGHHPLLLVGGATGLIGDPKPDAERPMITYEQVAHNIAGLKKQAEDIFGFEVVNNYDWTKDINVIDFLRDYGKYFNVNYMLAKDKVKSRMDSGITYAEFSYMILQALDFLYLYEKRNCTLQVAGSDQWGNITSGIELIRKKLDKTAYGMVMPLVTDSTGKKFGKTEGNALWLDKNKTSSYEMYQYLINLEDSMIIDYLKKLTFLTPEEIMEIEKQHNEAPHLRIAHKALARDIIVGLHGEEEYNKAVKISQALFGGDLEGLSAEDILQAGKQVPSIEVAPGDKLIDLLVNSKICSSRREAREMLASGAISINNVRHSDENEIIDENCAIDGKVMIIRKGKKKQFIGIMK
ncbi:MAG: tyrosine--tRNA ligase [Erysipelotrichaceae bacterium]|nr:tyrosine--tRNA ligase [Erysipelotrichaceae bacterium]